jgi:hypothetical protein
MMLDRDHIAKMLRGYPDALHPTEIARKTILPRLILIHTHIFPVAATKSHLSDQVLLADVSNFSNELLFCPWHCILAVKSRNLRVGYSDDAHIWVGDGTERFS